MNNTKISQLLKFFTRKFFFVILCFSILFSAGISEAAEPAPAFGARPAQSSGMPRIAAIFPQSLALIYLFEAQGQLCAFPLQTLKIEDKKSFFYDIMTPYKAFIKDTGTNNKPNIETIMSIKPDFAIIADVKNPIEENLAKINCNVFKFAGNFAGIERWLKDVSDFGVLCGKSEKAQKYTNYFKEKINIVSEKLKNIKLHDKKKVIYLMYINGKIISRGARINFGIEILKLFKEFVTVLNTENDMNSRDLPVSAEELINLDPDYIFIDKVDHSSNETIILKEDFWKKLKAYNDKKIYIIPYDDPACSITCWYFNLCAPLGVLWTAKVLFPAEFSDVDLNALSVDFHKTFLNIDISKYKTVNTNFMRTVNQ